MMQPLLVVTSHDEGRNAQVTLWPDRIERVRERSRASLSRARQDTEVTPVRAVSSVQAKKDGMRYTKVIVFASGNTIEFRLGHDEAQRFKDALMHLVLNGHEPAPSPVPAPPAGAWHPDPVGRHQLRYFDGVRWTPNVSDNGVQAVDAEGI